MTDDEKPAREAKPKTRTEEDAELERQIRAERKFTLEEAIGRLAGPGCMKGASPITRHEQAVAAIHEYLHKHLTDSPGALATVLNRRLKESELLLADLDHPLVVLSRYTRMVLDSEFRFADLVREVDTEWGRQYSERPMFEIDGRSPHPDDPYTLESVRAKLTEFLAGLPTTNS